MANRLISPLSTIRSQLFSEHAINDQVAAIKNAMDKHTSLLLLTYLNGLAFGIAAAVIIILVSYDSPTLMQFACINTNCGLLSHVFSIFNVVLIGGAIISLLTVLLSRGLYRLFAAKNH